MILKNDVDILSADFVHSNKMKKKVTHDKLHALDTTKNNHFIHSF